MTITHNVSNHVSSWFCKIMRGVLPIIGLLGLTLSSCGKEETPKKQEVREYARAAYTTEAKNATASGVKFTDVTQPSGIAFVHHTGAFGKKWMPETIGSGGGFFDYDNDGRADIFLVNGADWPGQPATSPAPTCKLFRNRGNGTFEDVTVSANLAISKYGMGCAFADYDRDGDEDIYLTAVGDATLLRNDNGKFVDVTSTAGVNARDPITPDVPPWSTSATWFDYDLDGWLDLYVANYVKWTPETDIYTTLDGKHKSYATPQQYKGQSGRLYRNLANGRFEDVTVKAGVFRDDGKSMGLIASDFDGDFRPDLFVTNDTVANFLFLNKGDGTFEEIATHAGCGYDEAGRARAGMGVDVGDLRNTGVSTVAIGNFSGEPVSLYAQVSPLLFQDLAGPMRIARPTLPCLTFGLRFVDVNLDGYLDFLLANGHIEPEINVVQKEVTFAQRPQLFINDKQSTFIDATESAGEPFTQPIVGRGIATADFDHDGDEDVLYTINGGPAKLLRNDTPKSTESNWLKVALKGPASNFRGIGALVTVNSGSVVQRRSVLAGSGYLTQSDTTLTIGLGAASSAEVSVTWRPGVESPVQSFSANSVAEIAYPGKP